MVIIILSLTERITIEKLQIHTLFHIKTYKKFILFTPAQKNFVKSLHTLFNYTNNV